MITIPKGIFGFSVYTFFLFSAAAMLPAYALDPHSEKFILVMGGLAAWRYSWGCIHFIRSFIYRKLTFPRLRAAVSAQAESLMPPHVYLLITSFRIEEETTRRVYQASIEEAIRCAIPATIIASIVDLTDEFLIRELFQQSNPPEHVTLDIVRIPGTGKRDGLAHGFRAIQRANPLPGSVVAVIDGDSILEKGLIRKCAPFFRMIPQLGALTTDEECDVKGSRLIREWHHMRFAQRHILMSSVSLSGKVLTLTGRMSMFRVEIITHSDFISHVENDFIEHWRLGRFKFLTGDDKSSWYWVLKNGYDMLYIPDTLVLTVEHPPSENFFRATTMLMFRWFGNMLRTNGRALKLGPWRCGFFPWWCILDQRISMWTSLSGLVIVSMFSLAKSWSVFLIYVVWIGFTRWIMTLMLASSRPVLSWYYPFLIYYNQIWGSLIKTYVFFRLDRQSWTRQKTRLQRNLTTEQQNFLSLTSVVMHSTAFIFFIALIGLLSGVLALPLF